MSTATRIAARGSGPGPVIAGVRAVLDGRTLCPGTTLFDSSGGVSVMVAPLPAEECRPGADHAVTVSAGFPPDPAAVAGIVFWLSRRDTSGGWARERLGETDRFGCLAFSPGPAGREYRLSADAAVVARPPAVFAHAPTRAAQVPRRAGWFRRAGFDLAMDSPAGWAAAEPGAAVLAETPLDPDLHFSFPDAPAAAAHAVARSADGREVHEVFPLRPTADGASWEGLLCLPPDAAWDELRVEPLTPELVDSLGPRERRAVAARLAEKVADWGDDRPAADGPTYRELWEPVAAFLTEPRPEASAMTCPVCRAWADGWAAKLDGLRAGLLGGTPVCRAHLTGPENVVVGSARDAWPRPDRDVYDRCGRLLGDLLDDRGPARRAFLHPYPGEVRDRAGDQAIGLLAAVAAAGLWRGGDRGRAADTGAEAAARLQAAVGLDGTPKPAFAAALTPPAEHPLGGLWAAVAERLGGTSVQGFLSFRRLTLVVAPSADEAPPFRPVRDRPVVVRPLLYDRERGRGVLARVEFTPFAEGCSELYVDVGALGFRAVDATFLRGIDTAWRAVRSTLARELGGAAVCLRVVVGEDASPAPALQGASAGVAVACALLALACGDGLDEDAAVTGELGPVAPGADLATATAGWTGHVPEKLAAARARGLGRAVVGVTGEGMRLPGKLDRTPVPEFAVIPACTVGDAYAALRRGPFVSLTELLDDSRRGELLDRWLAGSRVLTTTVMRQLIAAYRLVQEESGDEAARRLLGEFDARAAARGVVAASDQHREILDALRYGLPTDPVHVPHLEISVEELLTRPGYPALLRAIRASEIDPPRAVREFDALLRRPAFRTSAFVGYLHGQALRKEERLPEALHVLEEAERLIRAGGDATDEIRLEVYRGLGAVCRKIAKSRLDRVLAGEAGVEPWQEYRDRAEAYFKAGEAVIRRLPGSRQATTADFHHSYGYFYLQFGYLAWKAGGRADGEAFRAALPQAAGHFWLSARSDPTWGAPDARLQVVRHKMYQLGVPDAGDELEAGYVRAQRKTAAEALAKPEAGLSEILCWCGTVLLGRNRRVTAPWVRQKLVEALCRRIESRGARQCHDFDLEMLLDGVEGHTLGPVVELFRQAARWDDREYAEFIHAQTRDQLAAGTIDAPTAAAWVENARKLVADYLHEHPGHPGATALRAALPRCV